MLVWSIIKWRCQGWKRFGELVHGDLFTAKVRHAIPAIEWPVHAQDIDAIMTLKRTRNAVVLAHNYQTPEIFHCVADLVATVLPLRAKR